MVVGISMQPDLLEDLARRAFEHPWIELTITLEIPLLVHEFDEGRKRQWHARGGCCTELRGVSVAAGIHPRLARGVVGVTTSKFQGVRAGCKA
jgi:hypothetical protein